MLRLAEEKELIQVHSLYKSQLGREFCVWNESYPGWEEIREDYKTGNLFVLEEGGRIVGALSIVPENEMDHLSCWQVFAVSREIARVAVSPDRQGRGLAGRMVQEIIPVLVSRGCRSIHLSVATGNIPACRTYEKAGFKTLGEAWLYGGEYYLMERLLFSDSSSL